MDRYLRISAQLFGIQTERMVHPGALMMPGPNPVLLVMQEIASLRLVVSVHGQRVATMVQGFEVDFRASAYR